MSDYVVVPHGTDFYVAEVSGSVVYLPDHKNDDTAYRRPVKWLNDKKPIARKLARSALLSRMKIQGTCAPAADLVGEIKECLDLAAGNHAPTFHRDLMTRLIPEVLSEIRGGRIDSYGFEDLIETVLKSLGAKECHVVPRNQDKGADLIATFRVAGAFQLRVAVQAKHWQPEPPVDRSVVEQLIREIEAETADLGMVITSGTISDDANRAAQEYFEATGIRIELVDGEQFAKLIVEHGIGTN
ncbi:MAG TPA: restriction endonuclease [Pyrinomonadaceae bacterium]|nr:restriction endonuclease [Pyrinomonadaceae bacterium]